MTSRLDTSYLRFAGPNALNNYVTMTATTSLLNFSNTNLTRPALLTSATSVDSCVIDAFGNIFISGSYNSASLVRLFNTTGSPSNYSLPITSASTPYIVKFNKYGFVTAYTILSNNQEIDSYFSQKLSLLLDSKGSLYWAGAFSGSATINHFSSTSSLVPSFGLSENVSGTVSGFIAKYSEAGLSIGYTQLERGPIKAMCKDPFTNLFVTGLIGSNLATTAVFSISSVPTSGRINFTIPPFATGVTSAVASYIIKYTNDSPVSWTIVGSNGANGNCSLSDIHSDNNGTIYAAGIQNYVSSAYDFTTGSLGTPRFTFPYLNNSSGIIVKYSSSGLVNSINVISPTSVGSLGVSSAVSMGIDSGGNLYSTGSYSNTNTVTPVYNFFGTSTLNYNQFPTGTSKLVGTGAVGSAAQGFSVALSGDGSVLVSGGFLDDSSVGAAWVFIRSGTSYQQLSKLVGLGFFGVVSQQGTSVDISKDGNTIASGGTLDSQPGQSNVGATWIFIRSGSNYFQFPTAASKLVGTGFSGSSGQGSSVVLSSDGSTLAVGGFNDVAGGIGATWVFVRSGGLGTSYTQLCPKLVGSGYTGVSNINQGNGSGKALGISGDGSTIVIGGRGDNSNTGAFWVFVRSGQGYSQFGGQTMKYVGSAAATSSFQGTSVAVSEDGSIIASSGIGDSTNIGATWIFIRSGNTYAQFCPKIVASGYSGTTPFYIGYNTSLSSNGNILAISSREDDQTGTGNVGATWIFIRSGQGYSQYGNATFKLVGSGYSGSSGQGGSLSLSSDGTILAIGGYQDNNASTGAVWVFNSIGATSSFGLPTGTISYINKWSSVGTALSQTVLDTLGTGSTTSVTCAPDDSVYVAGTKKEDTPVPVYNFSTASSTTQFTIPTTGVQNYIAKWDKYGTSASWTGLLGDPSITSIQTSSTLITSDSYNSVYFTGSMIQGSSAVSDFSTTPTIGITRYTFSSAVSNNVFLAKYLNNCTVDYLNNPSISGIKPPETSSSVSTKQYVDGSFETITVSNVPIDPSSNVVSVISPGQINRSVPISPIMDSGLNDNSNCICVDNANEFVYIGGMYSSSVPNAVYNTDGSYSGFSFGATMASSVYSAFVLKYNFSGQALGWSQIGSIANTSSALSLVTDKSGNLYTCGVMSNSTATNIYNFSNTNNFGTSPFSVSLIGTGQGSSAFIVSWTPTGIASKWTILGNSSAGAINEQFNGLALDSNQNIYACGQMLTTTTINVYDFSYNSTFGTSRFTIPTTISQTVGTFDAIIIKWSTIGTATSWTRLVSNNLTDLANSICVDSFDNLYCCGLYNNSTSVYDFSSTSVFGLSSFDLPYMGSNAPFVLRWSPAGVATGWTAIGGTAGGSQTASGLSVTTDSDNNLYLGGFYNSIGTYGLYNFNSTTIFPTSPIFNLPSMSFGQNAFLVKWSNGGLLQSATVLDSGSINSSGISLSTDSDNSVYMSGSYNNTSGTRAVYNFFTGQSAGAFSSGWTSPFSLPASVGNDPFLIKWNSSGTANSWTTLQDTGSGQKSGIAIDKYNGVHLTGYFFNTGTVLPVYNMSSTSTLGTLRYSFSATTTNNASFYIKYLANGQVNISPYTETFYVSIPRPLSTSKYRKTIILKTLGYEYRIVESTSDGYKTISTLTVNGPKTVQLYWSGTSWT